MEKKRLICPSCKREHKDPDNCEHCGFNVSAYREYAKTKNQSQNKPTSSVDESQNQVNNLHSIGSSSSRSDFTQTKSRSKLILLVAPLLALGGAYLFFSERQDIEINETSTSDPLAKPIAQQPKRNAKSDPAQSKKVSGKKFFYGVGKKINSTHHARNEIEAARNATVFIKTTWDTLGSGFFVDGNCTIITNRHVIEEPLQQTEEYKRRVENRLIEIDNKLQRLNQDYQSALQNGNQGKSQKIQREFTQLRHDRTIIFQQVYQELLEEKQFRDGSFVRNISVDLTVSLVNGDEYQIRSASVSGKFDLAKLSLDDVGCPFLEKGRSSSIIQGERLYTIGSPSGLAYTVTSGIFSGYRQQEDKQFLQTDAPINPGNSGGPLITQDGKIIGVNTSILANTEGIGFAIPFSVVEEEFF